MESKRFVKLYKQGSSYLEIWVDRETGVQYLYRMNGYSGGFTPLLDRDGKPLLASAEEMEQPCKKS